MYVAVVQVIIVHSSMKMFLNMVMVRSGMDRRQLFNRHVRTTIDADRYCHSCDAMVVLSDKEIRHSNTANESHGHLDRSEIHVLVNSQQHFIRLLVLIGLTLIGRHTGDLIIPFATGSLWLMALTLPISSAAVLRRIYELSTPAIALCTTNLTHLPYPDPNQWTKHQSIYYRRWLLHNSYLTLTT